MLADALQSPPVTDLSTAITAATNTVATMFDKQAAKRAAVQAQQQADQATRDASAAQGRLKQFAATAGQVPGWFYGLLGVGVFGLGVAYLITHSGKRRR